jgi:hypothetical protein
MRVLAVLAALAMTAAPAAAQPADKRIVGILDVRVEGVPKEIARQFQADLEKQLASTTYWLATQQRMRELMGNSTKWTEGCVVGACLAEVKTQTGADLVLLASITGSGTSFGHVVTLVSTHSGRYLAQDASRCEVCTVKEALTNATLAAAQLLTALPAEPPDEDAAQTAKLDLATTKLHAAHAATRQRHRIVGIAMTLTGVVVAGAGMTLYLAMDRSDGALAGAGLGAGLALGGVVALTF